MPLEPGALRTWRLCGGRGRTLWPTSGGLEAQGAGVVFVFEWLDRLLARAAAAKEA